MANFFSRLRRSSTDPAPAGNADHPVAQPAPPGGPSSPREPDSGWDDFSERLARTIRDLPERVYLIVEELASRTYVQFAADADRVDAECVSNLNRTLTRPADAQGEALLVGAGWSPHRPGEANWWRTLDLPATLAQARTVADMSVLALRDVYGVASPDSLSYTAWRDPEPVQPTFEDTWDDDWGNDDDDWKPEPEPPDPGENPLHLPTLGLPMTPTQP